MSGEYISREAVLVEAEKVPLKDRNYRKNAPTIIPAEEAAAKDINVPSKPYDLLYEEGGLGIR